MGQITVAELLLRTLVWEGLGHLFSVPGAPLFGFYDALYRRTGHPAPQADEA